MEVADGGGGGPLGDPLAGLTMPPGSPGPLGGVASQLSGMAGHLGNGAAGHRAAASSVVGSAWIGPDALRAGVSVHAIATAAATVGDACDHSASLLRTCEGKWSDAVTAWNKARRLANEAMAEEAAHRRAGAAALAALTPKQIKADPSAQTTAQDQADGADGWQSPLRAQATALGTKAVTDAVNAITTAGNAVSEITAVVNVVGSHPDASKDEFWDKFMDLGIGGPATAFTIPGAGGQITGWAARQRFLKAFDEGNLEQLAKDDPAAWAKVVEAEKTYGADSSEALRAFMGYSDATSADLAHAAAADAIPIDGLPGGALSNTLDVMGKVALPLAVLGDVYTLANGKATVLDRTLSGANLAGLGMAAAGTETGEAVAALVMVNGVADWVPVVGEVVVLGTAAYLAGEWIAGHWDDIKHWSADAAHFVSSTVTAGEHLVSQGVNAGEHLVSAGVHEGEHLVSSGLHDVTSGLSKAASALDPLNW